MYNRSPSRNHRSRGIKVKHILQICLLVAVCFWLIYQVKHSHDKKKEFDEKDAKLASEADGGSEILKLGRKDISRVTGAGADDKLHGEDDEEHETDEEGSRHEVDEQEREESRTEHREEEEDTGQGGGGDDEIDEHGEEKIDDENREEFVDEEKEREEGDGKNEDNDAGAKEGNEEGDIVLEDQDHEGGDKSTHEAREELYKADDASSEVAHDITTTMPDTDNSTVKHTDGNSKLIGKENLSQSSSEPLLEENSSIEMKEHEATEGANSSYSRLTGSPEYKDNLTTPEYSSSGNSTALRESNDQHQASNNLTKFESEHSTNMTQAQNATHEDSQNEGSNTTMGMFPQVNNTDLASDKNQLDIETVANSTQPVNHTSEGSLGSSGEVKLALAENITEPTETNVDNVNLEHAGTNKILTSNSENNVTAGGNESSESDAANYSTSTDLHDHIDDSVSSLTQEEKEYRTDLGTLPDIKLDVQHPDEVEAE